MKPFRFKLQAVLAVRQRAEQEALEAYARSLLLRQQAAQSLSLAEEELARNWRDLRNQIDRGCSAAEITRLQSGCHLIEEKKDRCQSALSDSEIAVNRALQQMLAARKEREAVEKCFDNQRRRHDRLRHREEQKMIDELVGLRNGGIGRGLVESRRSCR